MPAINLKKTSQKIYLVASIALVSFFVSYLMSTSLDTQANNYVEIDGKRIEVELAKTFEEKAKGLSNRDSLANGTGMLFLFDDKERLTFWMKDMRFDLDFIWISDYKIVDTHRNIPAPKQSSEPLATYSPSIPANKVLEVNAGWIKENFGNEDIRGKTIKIITQ